MPVTAYSSAFGALAAADETFHTVAANVPDLMVEIDFTNDPTDPARVWTDVTTDVRALSYQRGGRNSELQRTEAGTLNATLNNAAGDYDPTNTGGAYYPGVKRRRWIRVRAKWSGTVYVRWTGLIETWRQRWPSAGHDATVEITASDTFKVLNLYDLDGKSYVSDTSDQRVADVCADVGIGYTLADTGISTLDATGTLSEGTSALSHLQQVEETENGLIFAEGDGTITFQSRHYRANQVIAGSSGTVGDDTGEIPYRDSVAFDLDDADIATQAKVTPSGGTGQLWPPSGTTTTEMDAHFVSRLARTILSSDAAEAIACAQYLVGRYADPSPRLPQVELLGAASPTDWPTILGLGNSDYLTWKRRATAATITVNAFVERIAETVMPGSWTVLMQLSPAVDALPWILEHAVYGVSDSTTKAAY